MLKYLEISAGVFVRMIFFSLAISVFWGIAIIWAKINGMPSEDIQMWIVWGVIAVGISIVINVLISYFIDELRIIKKQ